LHYPGIRLDACVIFQDPGLAPWTDETQEPPIPQAVLEKPLQQALIEIFKAAHHIQIQDPVDGLPEYPRRYRIKCIIV